MIDPKERQDIVSTIYSTLESSQKKRKELNFDTLWDYWTMMIFNPDNQWYDTEKLRKDGSIEPLYNDEGGFRVTINYLNQEWLNIVSGEFLSPLKYRVSHKSFLNTDGTLNGANTRMFGDQAELPMVPDDYIDYVKEILGYYVGPDKMNIDVDRERIYAIRGSMGTAYLSQYWDEDSGNFNEVAMTKNGDRWDVISGEWSKDGQMFKMPKDGETLEVPKDLFDLGEEFMVDKIPEGEPKTEWLYPQQVFWSNDSEDYRKCSSVMIIDWISKKDALKRYSETILYGKNEETDFAKITSNNSGVSGNIISKIKSIASSISPSKTTDGGYTRIRVRRRKSPGEKRSQWFTLLDNTLVRAGDCPYSRSFDKSLGVYPFIARPKLGCVEGYPDISFMCSSQRLYNTFRDIGLEHWENKLIGALIGIGGGSGNLKTNITSGGGAKIIDSNVMLSPIQQTNLGPEFYLEINENKSNIQHFGPSKQLLVGARSQDANTATQATIQQAYGQRMTTYNLQRDAISWQMFFQDLFSLLSDPNLVMEKRNITVRNRMGDQIKEIEMSWDASTFDQVGEILVEAKDLVQQSDAERKSLIAEGLQVLGQANPAEAPEIQRTRNQLIKKWFEMADLDGVKWQAITPGTPTIQPEPAAIGLEQPTIAPNMETGENQFMATTAKNLPNDMQQMAQDLVSTK
jgi:hypothetical protein